MRILSNVNIDWLRYRVPAFAVSWLIILVGAGLMVTRGLPLGIDFSGGTLVTVRFEQPVAADAVRNALASIPGDKRIQQVDQASGVNASEWIIRLPLTEGGDQSTELTRVAAAVVTNLQGAGLPKLEVRSSEFVGPEIGADLQQKGIYATFASMLGIMAYIAFRFRWSFGVGALVASLHDVLITMSLFTLAGYELSLIVVSAILTLVGYGVNDQIVIFDRVRENLRSNRSEPMNAVINRSVNQTLPRTVITASATAMAVLALYLFGGDVLEPFAFVMLVGIITSTYSTVFIASAVAVLLSPKRKTVAASADAAARGGRKAGKAKAS